MAEELKIGCARPTGGPVGEEPQQEESQTEQIIKKEEKPMIEVGKKAYNDLKRIVRADIKKYQCA